MWAGPGSRRPDGPAPTRGRGSPSAFKGRWAGQAVTIRQERPRYIRACRPPPLPARSPVAARRDPGQSDPAPPERDGGRDRGRRDAARRALARRRRGATAARSASSRAGPNSSRSISRPSPSCADAASPSSPSTGAARACRAARLPSAPRATSGISTEYGRDLEAIRANVLEPYMPKPHFALGHSMGGAIALPSARVGRRCPSRRLVATSPMLALCMVKSPKRRGRDGAAAAPRRPRRAYVPGGGATSIAKKPLCRQPPDQRPGPLRPQRRHRRGARRRRHRRPDGGMARSQPSASCANSPIRAFRRVRTPTAPGRGRRAIRSARRR